MCHCRWVLPACCLLILVLVTNAGQNQPLAMRIGDDPMPAGALARLGLARGASGDSVHFVQFLPDGRRVVVVSDDPTMSRRTLGVWELLSGKGIWQTALYLPGPHEFSAYSSQLAA